METLVAFFNIVFIALFCWSYWRKQELPIRKFYWHALAAKFSAGTLVGIIYGISYASSDTFSMFEWSKELSLQARTDFFGYLNYLWSGGSPGYFEGVERTLFFVKIISVFALLTNDNYWITSLYLSLFSFLAAWKLTKVIWFNMPRLGIPAAIAFLFFPSCVFWASGVVKESVAMAGLFFLAALFLKVWWKQKIPLLDFVCGVIAVWTVWNLKYYYIGLFVPILLATWITRKVVETRKIDRYATEVAIWFSILLGLIFIGSFAHPNFSLHKILNVVVSNSITSTEASTPENIIHFYKLENTWLSIVINSPWALISGFFRPFVWEAATLLKFFVSIENLVMLVLAVMSFRSIGEMKNSPHRLLIMAVLVYSITLCIFLAISTPNFGTLVRYRIGFLPFLVLLLINRPIVVRALSKSFNVDILGLPR